MNLPYFEQCQLNFSNLLKEQSYLNQDFMEHLSYQYADVSKKLQDSSWGWYGANLEHETKPESTES